MSCFDSVVCVGCGRTIPDYDAHQPPKKTPCPDCGSRSVNVLMKPMNVVQGHRVSLRYEGVPAGRGRRKWFVRGFDGWDPGYALGRFVKKISIFDRRADRRYEHIVDPVTGEVIHHEDHPLTQHRGRGSAKKKRP